MDIFNLQASISLDISSYEEQIRRARESMEQLSGATANISTAVSNAGSNISGVGSKIKTVFSGIGKVAATVAKTATAAFAAVGAGTVKFLQSSVSVGEQFDAAMSTVAATMGVTVESIENLRDFAKEMGATTKFSAIEAADALNYMALAGYDADTAMSMLPNVLNLAAAGGIALANASDMVTDAQSALGLSIEQTTDLVDQIAKASSKANANVAQFGEAILTIGAAGQGLSGGTAELTTALGVLADSSMKGSTGGIYLRNVLTALKDAMNKTTGEAHKMLESMNLENVVYDAEGNMRALEDIIGDINAQMDGMTQQERENVFSTLFNSRDVKAAKTLFQATEFSIESVAKALQDAAVDWDKYAESEMFASEGFEGIAEEASQAFKSGMDKADFADYLKLEFDLDTTDAKTAANQLYEVLERGGSRWAQLQMAIESADGSASAMSQTMQKNLAGARKSFESAVEGAQIAVSEGIIPIMTDFVNLSTEGVRTLTEAFNENGFEGVISEVGGVLSGFIEKANEYIPEITAVITTITAAIANELPNIINAILPALSSAIPEVASALINALPQIISAISDSIPALISGISEIFPDIISSTIEIINVIVETLIDNADMIITAASDLILTLANGLVESLPVLLPQITTLIITICTALTQPDMLEKLIDAAIQITLALADGLIDSIDIILDKAPEIIDNLVDAITKATPKLVEAALKIAGKLIDYLTRPSTWKNIFKIGTTIITSIAKSIVNLGSGFEEMFSEVGDKIIEWMKPAPGMFDNFGSSIQTGVSEALEKVGLSDAYNELIDDIVIGLEIDAKNAEEFRDNVKEGWDVITNGETWDLIKQSVSEIGDGIKSWFNTTDYGETWLTGWESIKLTWSTFWDDVKVGWGTIIDGEPKQWGKDLVDNFIAGIKEKMAELEKSLEDFGGMVYDYLHHSEPEKGKLADDEKWGSDFAQNFIDGITEKSSALQQAVENMAGNISGAFEIGVNFASENTDKIGAFISDAINNIETLNLSQIGSNIEDVLSNARIESGVNTSEYDYSTVYNEKREESNENSAVNVFGGVNITIQGENKNPQQIAEEIAEELQKLTNMQSMIGGKTAWDR